MGRRINGTSEGRGRADFLDAMSDLLWAAFGAALILEGALPLLVPAAWRRVMAQLLSLKDGQIRFYGLVSAALGLLLLWLAT